MAVGIGAAAAVLSGAAAPHFRNAESSRNPSQIRQAAEQFEGLLMEQLLRSARESGSGWLGGGDDESGSTATDFAEQEMAAALASKGGIGLADLVVKGLTRAARKAPE